MNSIKYDLYTTDDAVTPVAVDIVSGYQHNMLGDTSVKTFYVKGYNVLGDNIDSNQDDGNAVVPPLTVLTFTWDTLTASTQFGVDGPTMEFSSDGGSTFSDAGSDTVYVGSGGPYVLREKIVNTNDSLKFNAKGSAANFGGNMIVSGGGTIYDTTESMFNGCSNLTSLDVTSFNTSFVTNMENMFMGCSNLTSLDLTSFNTSVVTNMGDMFNDCSNLTSLDLTSFNTSVVTEMYSMFNGCSNLTSLDVTSFNTSFVTNMENMFMGCSNLTSLDLTSFNTSVVTDIHSMFADCTSLICITNIDSTNSINTSNMFANAPALIQPDATAQTDLMDTDGADWTNPNPCP